MSKNEYGYAVGERCSCGDSTCRIMMFPANVRTEKTNRVTHEITFPLVSVEILMGATCGRKFGRAF
jgi:hypothetical protein